MDAADRPHRHRSNSNNSATISTELFIYFTSLLSSSSSMKISSKSILSPGRAREPTSQISLSNSLSRRLRSNGSMRGGQASPMFSTSNAKKRGCGFENPEPSSPKVTCIGQVRVKTKKQGKKLRKRSTRRGEPSFRRIEQNNNDDDDHDHHVEASENPDNSQNHVNHQFLNHQQPRECLPLRNRKWVHFPLSICEALRAFRAEFNCFLPCRSSCMASEKEKDEKAVTDSGNDRSCGAVFTRWLVAVQEADGKGREIELVVGEEDEREESSRYRRRSYRRHVFEEIEFKDESFEGGSGSGQEEEARVSICIPPKNALLLMRCRSDPVRMAALANKFWEAPAPKLEEDVTEVDEDGGNDKNQQKERKVEQGLQHNKEQVLVCEELRSCETTEEEHQIQEAEKSLALLESEDGDEEKRPDIKLQAVTSAINLEQEVSEPVVAEDNLYDDSLLEKISDTGYLQNDENEEKMLQFQQDWEEQNPTKEEAQEIEIPVSVELKQEVVQNMQRQEPRQPQTLVHEELELAEWSREEKEEAMMTHERSEPEDRQTYVKSRERESEPLLPDCLLLMMCEPKLSMEVSKETWVCSTDFIKRMPEHCRPSVNKMNGGDDPIKTRVSRDSIPPLPANNTLQQPPRSSCSYPSKPPPRVAGAESMATVIGQKLLGGKAYEPFVLTRCKSEPMRSAAKLAPDGCFWTNRKIEPHRPATLGVGAAGVV